jgi:tetratricopeptide (TPR) repeat protein
MQFPGQTPSTFRVAALLLLVLLALAVPAVEVARAGIYSTIEPRWALGGNDYRKFQERTLTPLKQLATNDPNVTLDFWQKNYYLAAVAIMASKDPPSRGQPDPLTPEERLDFGACLLRVREPGKDMPQKAIAHLNAAVERDKDNFLVMSTLATAYQMTGDYLRANDWLGEAWRYWGKDFDQLSAKHKALLAKAFNWTKADLEGPRARTDFNWYAKCEKYQRQLVRLRLREKQSGAINFATAAPMQRLDLLFDPIPPPADYKPLQFTTEDGKFEAGKIAAAQKAKLPPDAIEIVEQLLVWTPDDLRLFWLLGELFNANGFVVPDAQLVFDELFKKYMQQTPELQSLTTTNDPKLLKEVALKFVQKYPELGSHYQAVTSYVPPRAGVENLVAPDKKDKSDAVPAQTPKPDATPATAPLNIDWQTLGVGLAAGLFIGFLLAWRIRDALRRRQTH